MIVLFPMLNHNKSKSRTINCRIVRTISTGDTEASRINVEEDNGKGVQAKRVARFLQSIQLKILDFDTVKSGSN